MKDLAKIETTHLSGSAERPCPARILRTRSTSLIHRHCICSESTERGIPIPPRGCLRETDMESRDFLYAGVIAMSALVFFMMGLFCARKRIRTQRKLHVPFNDSGCLTELPPEEQMDVKLPRDQFGAVPRLISPQIRARFGNN